MSNRNLFLLVRSIYTARTKKLDPLTPSYLYRQYTSKKSSKTNKGSSDSCEEESESESTYGCETPTSRFPTFPMCGEEESRDSPKLAADCPPPGCPVCPPPKEKPPCAPVCAEGPKKPVVCPPKSSTVNLLRMISLLLVLPGIIAFSVFTFMTHDEIYRPPFVEYPYMRKKNFAGRKWPWNSYKSLFYNSRVNALYDGYEEEEELDEVLDEPEEEVVVEPDPVAPEANEENKDKEE